MAELGPPNLTDRVGGLPPPDISDRVDAPPVRAMNVGTQAEPRVIPAFPRSQPIMLNGEEQTLDVDSMPAPQARKAGVQARMFGVTPVMASGAPADWGDADRQQRIGVLAGLPALRQYAEQSPHHAASLLDDLDNLGVLDFAFGRPTKSPVPTEAVGPYADYLRSQGGEPDSVPGWLRNLGLDVSNLLLNMKIFKELKFDGAVDMEAVQKEQTRIAGERAALPGADKPLGKLLYGGQSLVTNLAPYMIHPGVAFGLMYAEGTAQTYMALRQHGYEHEEAADVGEVAGFASGVVGMLTGQQLFGSLLPKAALQIVGDAVPGAVQRAFYDNPMLWKFLRDVGVNQLHAAGMQMAMAVTDAAIVEGYDAYSHKHALHLSVFTDTLQRSAMDSLKLLPLSIYAGMRQASHRAALYELGGPFREFEKATAESMDVEQRIFDEYEKQGHALRSLKEAADIDSAVSAVQRSQFFKESPEEGKRLIQSMLHPRKTQSVFVNPEAVLGLPEAEVSKLGIKNMSESLVSGAPVEIPTADFLTTPSAPQMSRDTAAAADLLTPRE